MRGGLKCCLKRKLHHPERVSRETERRQETVLKPRELQNPGGHTNTQVRNTQKTHMHTLIHNAHTKTQTQLSNTQDIHHIQSTHKHSHTTTTITAATIIRITDRRKWSRMARWFNCSIHKLLALQASGPEFKPQNQQQQKKPFVLVA